MKKRLAAMYRRVRENPCSGRVGYQAVDALAEAKTRLRFAAAEDAGYVRLRIEPDDDPDLSFADDDDSDTRGDRAANKRIRELAENEGVWGVIGEWTLTPDDDDSWKHEDSCWGFIGDDDCDPRPGGNPYVPDIMEATLDALRAAIKARSRAVALRDELTNNAYAGA